MHGRCSLLANAAATIVLTRLHIGLHLLLLRCACKPFLQDAAAIQALLVRLSSSDAAQVQDIWDALLTARRDCEAMAARGVRVSRDISRDWQETVSDLIDRVVAQDSELAQLRQQVCARGVGAGLGRLGSVLSRICVRCTFARRLWWARCFAALQQLFCVVCSCVCLVVLCQHTNKTILLGAHVHASFLVHQALSVSCTVLWQLFTPAAEAGNAAGRIIQQHSSQCSCNSSHSSRFQQRQPVWLSSVKCCWQQRGGSAQPGDTLEAAEGQAHAQPAGAQQAAGRHTTGVAGGAAPDSRVTGGLSCAADSAGHADK